MERIKVTVREGYARWAQRYDAYANSLILIEEPIVRRLSGEVRGKRLLDVACGTGRHSVYFDAAGARVIGVDATPEMLAVARSKRSTVGWLRADMAALPFADASFDVVVHALALDHVAEMGPAIAEAFRVLAPGGALLISGYHPAFLWKQVPPHFKTEVGGPEYELPAFAHLAADYVTEVLGLGMRLTHLSEPLVDEAIVAQLPKYREHLGTPLAVVLRAEKRRV